MRISKSQLAAFPTVKLEVVNARITFGNPAQAGWLALLDKDGNVVMSAGRPAWNILFANANGGFYTVHRVVE